MVDCESQWDHLIAVLARDPKAAELIRTDQVTQVVVKDEQAMATLSFGGTFEWHWEDGQWLLKGHL